MCLCEMAHFSWSLIVSLGRFSPQTTMSAFATSCLVPKGLILKRGVISELEQHRLLQEIASNPWSKVLSRRTQHYGSRYDYKQRNVVNDASVLPMSDCPMPEGALVLDLFTRLNDDHGPNQCIVNEYLSKQSISAHTDASCFGRVVVTLSLGDSTVMTFTRSNHASFSVALNAGDMVILSGDARYEWKHETKAIARDCYRRVSVTYRTVIQ